MEWLDVLRRIEAGEDRHTEFKRGLGDLSAVGKAICAFSNTEDGVIVLGVADTREIVGVKEGAEAVEERLTAFLHTGCSSPISARPGRHQDPQGRVHWVEVARQRGFEPMRYDGRVWIRRERSSVEPSPTELQELYNTFGYILTEERAIQDASVEHIDVAAFHRYLRRLGFETDEEPQPDTEDDLRNRSVLVEIGGEARATLYGMLAFGRTPQRYPQTRNFRVECVAYTGDDRWFQGLGRFESYRNLVREDRHLLPKAAIREALVNAVIHRDYAITGSTTFIEVFSNRVDVTSPGALPNHMTVAQVRAGANPRARNDSMGHFMAGMGFMERRGRGWLIMRQAMRGFNDTEPELLQDERNQFVRVTFRLDGEAA